MAQYELTVMAQYECRASRERIVSPYGENTVNEPRGCHSGPEKSTETCQSVLFVPPPPHSLLTRLTRNVGVLDMQRHYLLQRKKTVQTLHYCWYVIDRKEKEKIERIRSFPRDGCLVHATAFSRFLYVSACEEQVSVTGTVGAVLLLYCTARSSSSSSSISSSSGYFLGKIISVHLLWFVK